MKDISSNSMLNTLENYIKLIMVYHLYQKLLNLKSRKALNHGLVLKKVHRGIKFNQKTWLKAYDDTNTKLKKETKSDFEKDFFKLMDNAVFGKPVENVRKHRDIELVRRERTLHEKWNNLKIVNCIRQNFPLSFFNYFVQSELRFDIL